MLENSGDVFARAASDLGFHLGVTLAAFGDLLGQFIHPLRVAAAAAVKAVAGALRIVTWNELRERFLEKVGSRVANSEVTSES